MTQGGFADLAVIKTARVAKLVDAPGLGPDGGNTVRVRVPPRAPHSSETMRNTVQAVNCSRHSPLFPQN